MDDTSASSPLMTSSDDDTIAKIYFGPMQSPEKKFAPMLSPRVFPTHSLDAPGPSLFRRSPRLSSPPLHPRDGDQKQTDCTEQDEDGDEEDASLDKGSSDLWLGTPLQNMLRKDEPSSAIASRIMRAHDNPSPPPKALRTSNPRRMSKLANELVFPVIDISGESSDAMVESLLPPSTDTPTPPPVDLLDLSPIPSPTNQRLDSPSPTPRCPARSMTSTTLDANAEIDLISFEHSVLLSPNSQPTIQAPSPRLPQQSLQTVDDLLFSSPQHMNNREDTRMSDSYVPEPPIPQDADNDSQLLVPALSTPPRRRSPRLSSLPPSPNPAEQLKTPGATPKASSPRPKSTQSRKRRREQAEKSADSFLSPNKTSWSADSDNTDDESDRSRLSSRQGQRDRKRARKDEDVSSELQHLQLAESLSPESARILKTLMTPSKSTPNSPRPDIVMDESNIFPAAPFDFQLEHQGDNPPASSSRTLMNVQRPPPGYIIPQSLTPVRGPPGTRSLIPPNSPVKLTLTPAPEDSSRTPARRVPIFASQDPSLMNQGSVVPPLGREIASGLVYTPVFSRPPIDSPSRSPAKRIPVSEAMAIDIDSRTKGPTSNKPLAVRARTRSISAEPPQIADSMVASNKPIQPRATANIAAASGMSSRAGPSSVKLSQASTLIAPPVKSGLSGKRVLPSQVESRIPRIGSKPKATLDARNSKLPLPLTRGSNGPNTQPSRLPSPVKSTARKVTHLPSASSSGSEDSGSGSTSAEAGPSSRPARFNPPTVKVKRKRELEKAPSPRPMIKMRQVVPGMFGGPVKKPAASIAESIVPVSNPPPSPVKHTAQQRGPIIVREVVKGTLQDFELRTTSKNLQALSEAREKEQAEMAKFGPESQEGLLSIAGRTAPFTFECPVPEKAGDKMEVEPGFPSQDAASPSPTRVSSDTILAETASQGDSEQHATSGARRSTRARKIVQPADIFGTVMTGVSTSGARRRSGTGPPKGSAPANLVFHTNGIALKTLTNSNTARNQHYYAQLETHIIRKAGNRPESPTMKLRTILEKQKEEQGKKRAERAKRRRLEDGGNAEGDSSMDVDIEDSVILKHRRGPGEDEDYETPARPDIAGRRVKWDRGLEKAVYLDEIEIQPGRREGSMAPQKGCLVVVSTRAPLDSLGNAVDANAPLELNSEKVVVTKYVYDNDEEAQVAEPRNTRSKARKR